MKNIKANDIHRKWHLINAQNKILGRLASDISQILTGKNKTYYTPYLDTGDFVVVINAKEIILSGKKEKQKRYFRHSGYPGGLYVKTVSKVRENNPQLLVRHAVKGMLPKTKLAKIMLKKLFVYPESEHPYSDKFKGQNPNIKVTNQG